MVQMWLLWLPKKPKAAGTGAAKTSSGGSEPQNEAASSSCFSCRRRLSKLMRKLKKQGGVSSRRQSSSVQCCRYDPLSYSLNFDTSGFGSLVDDHDDYYYKFYAFSSRFVANPTTLTSSPSRPASH